MDDRQALEQLTKLRLKLIKQRIDTEKRGSSWTSGTVGNGTATGIDLLQAEFLKREQLERQLKEARESSHKTRRSPSQDDYFKEILPVLMTQNVQLQQVAMQQMVKSSVAESATSNKQQPSRHPYEFRTDLEQVTHREMTPFTGLPFTSATAKAEARKSVASACDRHPRRRSNQIQRGVSSPVRATERLSHDKPRSAPRAEGFLNKPSCRDPSLAAYPFPGTRKIRKLRHVFYIVWFCVSLLSLLKKITQRRLEAMKRLDEMIQGVVSELHQSYYLDAEGPVFGSLQDAIRDDCLDFKIKSPGMFQRLSAENKAAVDELSFIVETVVYSIINIKDASEPLSPTREGVLWYMVQPGTFYPADYLWQVEKDMLLFDDRGAVTTVDSQGGVMLVLGLFISRALVSTLILNPVHSGLSEEMPSHVAGSNLKVLASIFMKIVRDLSVRQKGRPMPQAAEISSQLCNDEELKYLFKKMESSFIWSKAKLKHWAEAYFESVKTS